jgi:hypothetical protein
MKKIDWCVDWRAAVLGLGVGCLALVCACAGVAGLMARGAVGIRWADYFAAGILVVSALLGGLTALLAGGGPMDALLTGGGELVVLLALNVLLNEGKMEGIAATALAVFGGSGAAMLLRLGQGRGKRRRRKR